ncbi:hypothetical protein ARMGADRAFT_692593 [Armillaria gallica]|uniref:Uncharacterized protein n=1 Tax=Armillaria gallica TaxID=47427 RepID=A0A2H3E4T6_ARMGA|nr:hypothetical protein ARMGADRAFT_692593 [Armillaria gallica]
MLTLLSLTSNQTTRPWSRTWPAPPLSTTRLRAIMITKDIHLRWTVHHLQARTPSHLTNSPSRLRLIIMMTAILLSSCVQNRLGIPTLTQMYTVTTTRFAFSSLCHIAIRQSSKLDAICGSSLLSWMRSLSLYFVLISLLSAYLNSVLVFGICHGGYVRANSKISRE